MSRKIEKCLDELMVLHEAVARTLLKEFPEAHGVNFIIDRDVPMAYPLDDVPEGYAEGYTDEALTARSNELLAPISARAREIMSTFTDIGIEERAYNLTAKRQGTKGFIQLTASAVGCVGAIFVAKSLLSLPRAIVNLDPAQLHIVAIADDHSTHTDFDISEDADLRTSLQRLKDQGLLLSQEFLKPKELKNLFKWLDYFDFGTTPVHIEKTHPVIRLIQKSAEPEKDLYYIPGNISEDIQARGIPYNPVNGFDMSDQIIADKDVPKTSLASKPI